LPDDVLGKGREIAKGLTNFFWLMSEFHDNLNEGVGSTKRVPELLGRLFGFRAFAHQKKSSLTQQILNDAIDMLTVAVWGFSNAPRFVSMIERLNKVLALCAAKAEQREKGAEIQTARRNSTEPTR